jgi:hypothetical protein
LATYDVRLAVLESGEMGHKVLQDHANVFCQMFMGWRMADDLKVFAKLPSGQLRVNVLDATCEHSVAGMVVTHIAREIRAWFLHRLELHKIPLHDIVDAHLVVQMKSAIAPSRKRGITLDWTCDATIRTRDREYSAHLAEPHTWIPMQ